MGVCGFFLSNGEIPESFFSLFLKHQREKVFSMGRSSVCQIETKNRKKFSGSAPTASCSNQRFSWYCMQGKSGSLAGGLSEFAVWSFSFLESYFMNICWDTAVNTMRSELTGKVCALFHDNPTGTYQLHCDWHLGSLSPNKELSTV